jgi:predicted nucleotidyltransferase
MGKMFGDYIVSAERRIYERFDRKEVLKLLEELKAEMKEKLGDKLAGLLLFGSHSTGDYTRPQMWTI